MSTLREAAEKALAALDTHMFLNDHCGMEVEKSGAVPVMNALETLRDALEKPDAPAGGEREAFDYWQEAHRLSDALRQHLAAIPAQPQPTGDFADALEAVDNTLHGAIDHWQERALKAEAALAAPGAFTTAPHAEKRRPKSLKKYDK